MSDERIAEIERVLGEAEELGAAERQLLLIWLRESDAPFIFEHDGLWRHDHIRMCVAADNEVLGFEYWDDPDVTRECDESFGEFSLRLFNWNFYHNGVSVANEESWYWGEWSGEVDDELGAALNEHMHGDIPHVEDYVGEPELDRTAITRAFEDYICDIPGGELNFFVGPTGRVYVYVVDENRFDINHDLECALSRKRYCGMSIRNAVRYVHDTHTNEDGNSDYPEWSSYVEFCRDVLGCDDLPRIPLRRDVLPELMPISEDKAVERILELKLPFDRNV